MLYADTGYWIALLNEREALHAKAKACDAEFKGRKIVTSDAVLSELLNAFSPRGEQLRRAAVAYVRTLYASSRVTVVHARHSQFLEAIDYYEKRIDKEYSHVDCISFGIMKVHKITDALAHDHHFEQEGFVALLRR